MPLTIRHAIESDAAFLSQCNGQALGYAYDLLQTQVQLSAALCASGCILLIAEWDGLPVGYVHAQHYLVTYAPLMLDILALAVLPAFQKKGHGRALLCAAEDWAQQTGAAGIRLVSGEDRIQAHAFYLACGYRDCKGQRNFKKWLDLPHLQAVETPQPHSRLQKDSTNENDC